MSAVYPYCLSLKLVIFCEWSKYRLSSKINGSLGINCFVKLPSNAIRLTLSVLTQKTKFLLFSSNASNHAVKFGFTLKLNVKLVDVQSVTSTTYEIPSGFIGALMKNTLFGSLVLHNIAKLV